MSFRQTEQQNSSHRFLLMILLKNQALLPTPKEALGAIHTDIEKFAEAEHLTAHANSIKVRFEKK